MRRRPRDRLGAVCVRSSPLGPVPRGRDERHRKAHLPLAPRAAGSCAARNQAAVARRRSRRHGRGPPQMTPPQAASPGIAMASSPVLAVGRRRPDQLASARPRLCDHRPRAPVAADPAADRDIEFTDVTCLPDDDAPAPAPTSWRHPHPAGKRTATGFRRRRWPSLLTSHVGPGPAVTIVNERPRDLVSPPRPSAYH